MSRASKNMLHNTYVCIRYKSLLMFSNFRFPSHISHSTCSTSTQLSEVKSYHYISYLETDFEEIVYNVSSTICVSFNRFKFCQYSRYNNVVNRLFRATLEVDENVRIGTAVH
jgi:hypothetical protein